MCECVFFFCSCFRDNAKRKIIIGLLPAGCRIVVKDFAADVISLGFDAQPDQTDRTYCSIASDSPPRFFCQKSKYGSIQRNVF